MQKAIGGKEKRKDRRRKKKRERTITAHQGRRRMGAHRAHARISPTKHTCMHLLSKRILAVKLIVYGWRCALQCASKHPRSEQEKIKEENPPLFNLLQVGSVDGNKRKNKRKKERKNKQREGEQRSIDQSISATARARAAEMHHTVSSSITIAAPPGEYIWPTRHHSALSVPPPATALAQDPPDGRPPAPETLPATAACYDQNETATPHTAVQPATVPQTFDISKQTWPLGAGLPPSSCAGTCTGTPPHSSSSAPFLAHIEGHTYPWGWRIDADDGRGLLGSIGSVQGRGGIDTPPGNSPHRWTIEALPQTSHAPVSCPVRESAPPAPSTLDRGRPVYRLRPSAGRAPAGACQSQRGPPPATQTHTLSRYLTDLKPPTHS